MRATDAPGLDSKPNRDSHKGRLEYKRYGETDDCQDRPQWGRQPIELMAETCAKQEAKCAAAGCLRVPQQLLKASRWLCGILGHEGEDDDDLQHGTQDDAPQYVSSAKPWHRHYTYGIAMGAAPSET